MLTDLGTDGAFTGMANSGTGLASANSEVGSENKCPAEEQAWEQA